MNAFLRTQYIFAWQNFKGVALIGYFEQRQAPRSYSEMNCCSVKARLIFIWKRIWKYQDILTRLREFWGGGGRWYPHGNDPGQGLFLLNPFHLWLEVDPGPCCNSFYHISWNGVVSMTSHCADLWVDMCECVLFPSWTESAILWSMANTN